MWIFLIQSGKPPDMKPVAQRISSRPNALQGVPGEHEWLGSIFVSNIIKN
jgi:hypothetical protein